jgi:hypothetical protein
MTSPLIMTALMRLAEARAAIQLAVLAESPVQSDVEATLTTIDMAADFLHSALKKLDADPDADAYAPDTERGEER